jgi:hypothetical protein
MRIYVKINKIMQHQKLVKITVTNVKKLKSEEYFVYLFCGIYTYIRTCCAYTSVSDSRNDARALTSSIQSPPPPERHGSSELPKADAGRSFHLLGFACRQPRAACRGGRRGARAWAPTRPLLSPVSHEKQRPGRRGCWPTPSSGWSSGSRRREC